MCGFWSFYITVWINDGDFLCFHVVIFFYYFQVMSSFLSMSIFEKFQVNCICYSKIVAIFLKKNKDFFKSAEKHKIWFWKMLAPSTSCDVIKCYLYQKVRNTLVHYHEKFLTCSIHDSLITKGGIRSLPVLRKPKEPDINRAKYCKFKLL